MQLQTQSDGSQNDNCDCEAIDMRPVINIVHPPGQSRGWAARGGRGNLVWETRLGYRGRTGLGYLLDFSPSLPAKSGP